MSEEIPVANCSVEGCIKNSNQRQDKFGAILEHDDTKVLLCVNHAVEAVRNGSVQGWPFQDYIWVRLTEEQQEKEKDDFDSLAMYPKCSNEECGLRLTEDDVGRWLDTPQAEPVCESCDDLGATCETCTPPTWDTHENIAGTCERGRLGGSCPKKVENMCRNCATWDNVDNVWRCPTCQKDFEAAKDAHLEAQIESHIEMQADISRGK